MSAPAFTPGPLEVRMDGTMTGVWAAIGQVCIDPDTDKEWFRELAQTGTTHIRRDDAYPQHGSSFRPFDEAPEQFRPDDDCDEHLANARLWVAASELYALAEQFERVAEYELRKMQRENAEDDEGIRLRQLNLNLIRDTLAKARGEQ